RQVRVEASQNRAQSFSQNRGRPAEAVVQHGFANTRGIAPAPRGAEIARPMPEGRPAQPQPNGANPRFENRGQPQPQPNGANPRFENRGQPQPQPQPNGANPRFENRGQPQPQPNGANPRFENRAQPQPQPNGANPRF